MICYCLQPLNMNVIAGLAKQFKTLILASEVSSISYKLSGCLTPLQLL